MRRIASGLLYEDNILAILNEFFLLMHYEEILAEGMLWYVC